MEKKTNSNFFSEKQYVNKTAIICHIVICAVLLVAYSVEVLKGSRTIGYYAVFSLLAVVSPIAEISIYHKNKESGLIRHIMGFGYGIFYIFVIFTTTGITPFTYAIPMFVVITLFSDVKYCAMIVSTALLANVAEIVYRVMTTGYAQAEIPDVEIRIAVMLIVGIYVIITTRVIRKVNDVKLETIETEQKKTGILLENIIKTSTNMIDDIEQAADRMGRLEESVNNMRMSMYEVSEGSNETAESIQNQLERTEQIQNQIGKVKEAALEINTRLGEAGEEVSGGIEKVKHLSEQAEKSMEANDMVVSRMAQLTENTEKMNAIVDLINSIANRTGMLALNASIESARAGEAGRGFAVVAGEITSLSNQTKEATVNITQLIQDISVELKEVEEAVEIVTENNRSHVEITKEVTGSFEKIAETTKSIDGQAKEMEGAVEGLVKANESIVESITNVSATTEEISSHASETYSACEKNGELAGQVSEIVKNLSDYAEELKNQENNYHE